MFGVNEKKRIIKLHQKKYREEFQEFLVEGVKGVEEALMTQATVTAIIVEGGRESEPDVSTCIRLAEEKGIRVHSMVDKDIKELKTTETFPGIIAVVGMKHVTRSHLDLERPIVLLDQVNDPGNLGSIIRTADWFGIQQMILSEGSVDPYNPKVVRSTMGSIFRMKILESTQSVQDIDFLIQNGYTVVSLGMSGESVKKLTPSPKTVYVFGSESHGIRKEVLHMSQRVCTIPGSGHAESLNVGVAVGIVLFHIS